MCEATPRATVRLSKALESATTVRDFVEGHVCPVHGRHGMTALQLVASELVTNAVLYGAEPIRAEISCEGDALRVDVHDGRLDGEDPGASDQMGLLLVDKVAHAWGATGTPAGRTAWGTVLTGVSPPAQRPRSWETGEAAEASRVRGRRTAHA